jgi:hypothetical protein
MMGIESRDQLPSTPREHAIAVLVLAGLKPILKDMDRKMDMVLAKLDTILAWQRRVEADAEEVTRRNGTI